MTSIDTGLGKMPDSLMIFGCGYVGMAVARRFLEAGVRVGALTRNPETACKLRAMGVSDVVEAELDSPDWADLLRGDYSAVLNCVSSAGGGLSGYQKSYIDGMRQILDWSRERAIEKIVYTSSTSVYPQDGGVWVEETADLSEASDSGKLLIQAERLIEENADLFDSWYVFRLSGIYGPGRHFLLKQLREGGGTIPGSGDYHMNMIHLDDIVQAVACAICKNAPSGVYNVSDSKPEQKQVVMAYLAERLNMPVPVFAPDQVSPRLKRRGGRMPDRMIENGKALEALGWRPTYPTYKDGYSSILAGQ